MLAIELFQAFCLIHDDVLDEDKTRRGKPTIHEYFRHEKSLKPHASLRDMDTSGKHVFDNAKHFGSSMAILVGDLAYAWAEEWRDRGLAGLSASVQKRVSGVYGRMREEVIFGQALDVWHQAGDATLPQETINTLKTAWYSVIRPLQIGASLAHGTRDVLIFLEKYGMPVGRAYQLKDDFLDGEIDISTFNSFKKSYMSQTNRAIDSRPVSPALRMLLTGFAEFALERGA
jgi:geranylgeranyl diphosphate synthase type I